MTSPGAARADVGGAVDPTIAPERFTPQWLAGQLRTLMGSLHGRRLVVAYSGGLDSSVLLAALASLRRTQRFELRALHVNHGLQSASTRWAEHAAAQARRLRVPCERIRVSIERSLGESLEAVARTARYRALAAHLRPDELLLTAHHREDQLETLLLALMRGSGVRGLGAIAPATCWEGRLLLRPLLAVGRDELERYAMQRGLRWVEDPSNEDLRFDRSYLRRQVLPLLRQRWPAAALTAGRSAAHLREAHGLLQLLAERTLGPARDGTALRVSALARVPLRERRNALRTWIAERGLGTPDSSRLGEIAGPMLAARADALPCVRWRGGELRRHGDRLFALRAPPPRLREQAWRWRENARVVFEDGSALALARERYGDVELAALPARLQVRFRSGSERLASGAGVSLKELLRCYAIPPWQRLGVPLVADGERIIAVADLWLHPAYRASSGARAPGARGRFRWQPASLD